MTAVAWVTGASSITDPRIADALSDAGVEEVSVLHLGTAPPMVPVAVGIAGSVRVVVGSMNDDLLLAANVDDLDPRVWPGVLTDLLAAGAADAWLTPILMKKGRPAHTVTVLVGAARLDDVRRVLLSETTSIGLRMTAVSKVALSRRESTVELDGHAIRVKIATAEDGTVVNVMPEWEDVAAAARVMEIPSRRVLLMAHAAAGPLWVDATDAGGPA